jgi:hypothetical protein
LIRFSRRHLASSQSSTETTPSLLGCYPPFVHL